MAHLGRLGDEERLAREAIALEKQVFAGHPDVAGAGLRPSRWSRRAPNKPSGPGSAPGPDPRCVEAVAVVLGVAPAQPEPQLEPVSAAAIRWPGCTGAPSGPWLASVGPMLVPTCREAPSRGVASKVQPGPQQARQTPQQTQAR
jgi:hypothetical protein